MPSLSTPIGELQSEYGVVVVGSGYGGAIAACRMAEHAKTLGNGNPAYSVALFERGIERHAGEFPATLTGALRQVQFENAVGRIGSRTGLFDFRMNRDISVLVGCGLGGTSLINAGVMLPPTPDVLKDERWPHILSETAAVQGYFDAVRKMLDVSDYPGEPPLEKVEWLRKATAGTDFTVSPAPVAISFTTRRNTFDIQQHSCLLCGNCVTGCNHGAKNTVAVNYLPAAVNAGATIFCEIQTRAVQPGEDGEWLVHVRFNDKTLRPFGTPDVVIRARMVFLAAGTLGSTEILLRSRKWFDLSLSRKLGHGFSGNGDVIAFAYNAPDRANGFGYGDVVPRDATVGPTIAAVIDHRHNPLPDRMMIQEGAVPGALRVPLRFAAPFIARATEVRGDVAFDFRIRHIFREIDSLVRGVRHGALARTQTFLAMGVDNREGRMGLAGDRLRIIWRQAGYQDVYRRIAARIQELTARMRGRYVMNPFWSRFLGRRLMTVHPLGGCCIGERAEKAVVNAKGQVFSGSAGTEVHDGLYVCDGSVIPMPLGTNPALTISALAEHIAACATKSPRLEAPHSPAAEVSRVNPTVAGIKYAERLRGTLHHRNGQSRFEIVLHMSAESIDELITRRDHQLRLVGVARSPDLPWARRWTISDGTLNVLTDDPRTVDTKLLIYRLVLTSEATGRRLWLRGHKRINYRTLRRHPWLALTRVPFVVYDSDPDRSVDAVDATCPPPGVAAGPNLEVLGTVEAWDRIRDPKTFLGTDSDNAHIAGAGVIRSSILDAIRLSLSLRVTYERNALRRLRWRWRYNMFFFSTVIPLRVWAIRRTHRINPLDPREQFPIDPRILLDEPIKDHPDAPRFTVTRYKGTISRAPTRGPVMLAPGFGMSTLAFYAAGKESFAEYLHGLGYDVWLFDYRASDKLDVSLEQFDIDVLARGDFPDAIRKVHEVTKKKVRIVAHCLASMTMQMGLLAGTITPEHVHSMVLSQSFAIIDLPWPTRLKVRLHLPEILQYFNFRAVVTSDYDVRSNLRTRLLDRLLYFFPSDERCYEGVCRRLLFLYGEVVRHDNLDQRTHESFYHLFDRGNLAAFRHIGRMFIRGHISDRNGRNVYLRIENGAHVRVPITLLQGTANNMFLPSGARKTHRWLLDHGPFNGRNEKMFTLVETDGYGHLDNFIGKKAKDQVFPLISKALEDMEELNASSEA